MDPHHNPHPPANNSLGSYCDDFARQVKLSGDVVPYGEPALIICNHRTRVDWMFLWCLCLHQGQLSGLKIVLKESLKSIPGFGWATQVSLGLMGLVMERDPANQVIVEGFRIELKEIPAELVICH